MLFATCTSYIFTYLFYLLFLFISMFLLIYSILFFVVVGYQFNLMCLFLHIFIGVKTSSPQVTSLTRKLSARSSTFASLRVVGFRSSLSCVPMAQSSINSTLCVFGGIALTAPKPPSSTVLTMASSVIQDLQHHPMEATLVTHDSLAPLVLLEDNQVLLEKVVLQVQEVGSLTKDSVVQLDKQVWQDSQVP